MYLKPSNFLLRKKNLHKYIKD